MTTVPFHRRWENSLLFHQDAVVSEHSSIEHNSDAEVRIYVSVITSRGIYGFKNDDDIINVINRTNYC